MTPARKSRGFTLVELVVGCAVVALVCVVAAPGLTQARKSAGLAGSLANLRKIGETTGAYAADFDDQLWSFSWNVGNYTTQYTDLRAPSGNGEATGFQATDIARRRFDETIPPLDDRFPALWLSTLVLVDYLDESAPAEWAVSPGDAVRLGWQADPSNPPDLNEQGGEPWNRLFTAFGSSYMLMPAYFAPDEKVGSWQTIYQYAAYHDFCWIPGTVRFGGRRVAEVEHPSRKVHMAERASYFFGPRPAYFLHQQARVPVLMADGAATPRSSADTNASFRPNSPGPLLLTTTTDYVPNPIYDPPTLSGGTTDFDLETHYKWTRRGLRGIDFGGERAE